MTGHSKIYFLGRVSPLSTSLFCLFIICTFKRPSLRLFRFKIDQFVPFCMKTPKSLPKREKFINFKLSSRRLGRLKVHVINQKEVFYWWGKPYKKIKFFRTSWFNCNFSLPSNYLQNNKIIAWITIDRKIEKKIFHSFEFSKYFISQLLISRNDFLRQFSYWPIFSCNLKNVELTRTILLGANCSIFYFALVYEIIISYSKKLLLIQVQWCQITLLLILFFAY